MVFHLISCYLYYFSFMPSVNISENSKIVYKIYIFMDYIYMRYRYILPFTLTPSSTCWVNPPHYQTIIQNISGWNSWAFIIFFDNQLLNSSRLPIPFPCVMPLRQSNFIIFPKKISYSFPFTMSLFWLFPWSGIICLHSIALSPAYIFKSSFFLQEDFLVCTTVTHTMLPCMLPRKATGKLSSMCLKCSCTTA